MFDFDIQQLENGLTVVQLGGNLDATAGDDFSQRLLAVIDAGHRQIVVNCAELSYISSVALAVLIRARSRLINRGGRLSLASVRGGVADIFKIAGFDRIFDIYPSLADARASLDSD